MSALRPPLLAHDRQHVWIGIKFEFRSEIYTKSSGAVSIGWYETQICARPWSVRAACRADDCHPFWKKWEEQFHPEDAKRACCHTGWQVDRSVPGGIREF